MMFLSKTSVYLLVGTRMFTPEVAFAQVRKSETTMSVEPPVSGPIEKTMASPGDEGSSSAAETPTTDEKLPPALESEQSEAEGKTTKLAVESTENNASSVKEDGKEPSEKAEESKVDAHPKHMNQPQKTESLNFEALPFTYHQWRIDLEIGPRLLWVKDSSFDLFSDDNLLPAFQVRGGATIFARDRLSVAALAAWDTSGGKGDARELPTKIRLNRWTLGGEARYHILSRLYGYGGVALGVMQVSSSLGDPADPAILSFNQAVFSGELRAGAAVRVLGEGDGRVRALRGHVFVEAGYVYVSNAQLEYHVGDDGPLRPETVDLGNLSLSGPQVSAGVMVSF